MESDGAVLMLVEFKTDLRGEPVKESRPDVGNWRGWRLTLLLVLVLRDRKLLPNAVQKVSDEDDEDEDADVGSGEGC